MVYTVAKAAYLLLDTLLPAIIHGTDNKVDAATGQ